MPLHLQPAYRHLGIEKGSFPHTEKTAESIISLPIYPEITEEQVERVVGALGEALGA